MNNINETYYLVSLFSSVMILTLGIVLAFLRFPKGKIWNKPRAAGGYLAASYLLLAIGNIMEYFNHSTADDLLSLVGVTAVVSSFQALLFTATLLALIQPSFVRRKAVLTQVGIITVYSVFVLTSISLKWLPEVVMFAFILILYLLQLTSYTLLFRRKFAQCISTLEEYYDEEQDERLKWIQIGFYGALFIGLMGITSALIGMWLFIIFIILYTIFYTWTVIQFNNFRLWAQAVVPVVSSIENPVETKTITHEEEKDEVKKEIQLEKTEKIDTEEPDIHQLELEKAFKKHLDQWVLEKGFLKKDESVEDIAAILGTDKVFLRNYFTSHMNANFRTWRAELRIEEAKRIIQEHPEFSLSQIGEMTGFNHRGNFYNQFQKITNVPATEYREKIIAQKNK